MSKQLTPAAIDEYLNLEEILPALKDRTYRLVRNTGEFTVGIVGTGKAAEMGTLFRRGTALEALARADTVVLDKTGTITEGRPRVVSVQTFNGYDEAAALGLAAALESGSEHPIARAILDAEEGLLTELPLAQGIKFGSD